MAIPSKTTNFQSLKCQHFAICQTFSFQKMNYLRVENLLSCFSFMQMEEVSHLRSSPPHFSFITQRALFESLKLDIFLILLRNAWCQVWLYYVKTGKYFCSWNTTDNECTILVDNRFVFTWEYTSHCIYFCDWTCK